MLAGTSLREEGAETVIKSASSLIRWQHAIRLNAMLQAIQLPAGIAHLATSLANVNRNALPHSDLLYGKAANATRSKSYLSLILKIKYYY